MVFELNGRIDSGNAAETEARLQSQLTDGEPVILDAQKLDYISSAGLRILLRIRKKHPDLKLIHVGTEVYEILEMTGFTEMMQVEKACRVLSVEGCEVIGEGFNGRIYRIDPDTVVKVYKHADALAQIRHEREAARLALVLGVPTAISYDVVRVGDSYGSVFELLNARSFSEILAREPERMDWCVREYTAVLKLVHGISAPAGKLPSKREDTLKKIERVRAYLPEALGQKLARMVSALPETDRLIHGDCHTGNIVLAGNEVLLIDMDTLSVGLPIFELAYMFNAYIGFSENDPSIVQKFQGYDAHTAQDFWHRSLKAYLNAADDRGVQEAEAKVRCLSYTYMIDRMLRHSAGGSLPDKPLFDLWLRELTELLQQVDSLELRIGAEPSAAVNELRVEAETAQLLKVTDFVTHRLERSGCPAKTMMQICLAAEEVFVNISNYAYAPGKGTAAVRVEIEPEPVTAVLTFLDHGVPYDPVAHRPPDVTLPAQDRQIGGLGIYLTKKLMDDVSYEYRDGQNVLTLKKRLQPT